MLTNNCISPKKTPPLPKTDIEQDTYYITTKPRHWPLQFEIIVNCETNQQNDIRIRNTICERWKFR